MDDEEWSSFGYSFGFYLFPRMNIFGVLEIGILLFLRMRILRAFELNVFLFSRIRILWVRQLNEFSNIIGICMQQSRECTLVLFSSKSSFFEKDSRSCGRRVVCNYTYQVLICQ